ncbi:hypothetical protein KIN20_021924 [Parelaphostrongylus tenuis]|uniref:Uncharacterized protein n=1 Tax=Parelaphostrongylus tenuis TaxID=148309 RepID=A0AAD5MPI7_PARTN|nr:hypothetical protein KIN20_021924 [Parelaphostrongylus tenuis]
MKLIVTLCITLAAASYYSQPQGNPQQELSAPYRTPYGHHSYGRRPPYHSPSYYPRQRKRHSYSSSWRYDYDCPWMDDDYDESRERKSRKCSRCSPLKKLPFGANVAATIRYNTLLNGCLQAIISCPTTAKHLAVIGSVSEDQGEMVLTELAVGTGIQVVAQCRKDSKYHANSEEGTDVILDGIECFSLKLQQPRTNNTDQGQRELIVVSTPEPLPPPVIEVIVVEVQGPSLQGRNITYLELRKKPLEKNQPIRQRKSTDPESSAVQKVSRDDLDNEVADGSGSDDERFLTGSSI